MTPSEIESNNIKKNQSKKDKCQVNKTRYDQKKETINKNRRNKYAELNDEEKSSNNQHRRERYRESKSQTNESLDKLIVEFNQSINEPLDKICAICRRIYYVDQVRLNYLLSARHIGLISTMYNTTLNDNKIICCHTCIDNLRNNKLPNIFYENQLYPGDIPAELEALTDLEISLISILNES